MTEVKPVAKANRSLRSKVVSATVSLVVAAGALVGATASGAVATVLPPGQVWETQQSAADSNWRSVTWGGPANNKKFVAVSSTGTGNRVMTSPDGVDWELQNTPVSPVNPAWSSVTWGGPAGQEKFVAVSGSLPNANGKGVMTSLDGINWTLRSNMTNSQNWTTVAWGGSAGQEKFVALKSGGNNTTTQMTSTDGEIWPNLALSSASWRSLVWGGPAGSEKFVAIGGANNNDNAATRVMTSTDGENWNVYSPGYSNNWRSVTWGGAAGNQKYVAVAGDGGSGPDGRVATSADGVNWTAQSAPAIDWRSVTWGGTPGNERFVAVSATGDSRIMTSPDGIDWTLQDTPAKNVWQSVAWGGTAGDQKFVSVSASGEGNRVMTSGEVVVPPEPTPTPQPIPEPPAVIEKPRKAVALKASGKPNSSKRVVSWKRPSTAGHKPVVNYQLEVRRAGSKKVLIKATLKSAAKAVRYRLTRKQLLRSLRLQVRGESRAKLIKFTVTVRSWNSKGFGPKSITGIVVKA